MRNLLRLLLLSLMTVAKVEATDVPLPTLKAGDVVYSNVTVTSVSATDIYFVHARGGGNAKLKDLSPELQKRFGYNTAKAEAMQKAQTEANIRWRNQTISNAAVTQTRAAVESAQPTPPPAAEIPRPSIHAKSFLGARPPQIQVEKWLTVAPNTAGKFVLIDFWATWCGPCRASIPELNRYQKLFQDKLVVIGLSDESESEVRQMRAPKIEYATAIDTQAKTKRTLEVAGIPHCLVIDPQGIVRFEGHPGYLDEHIMRTIFARYGQ